MRKTGTLWVHAVLAGTLFFSSGCAALLVGAAAGVGGYAWVSGALVKEYPVSAEKTHQALLRALKQLDIHVTEDKGDRLSAVVRARLADGRAVKIGVDALTERSAKIRIRVGVFGDRLKSEMIVNALDKLL